MNVICYIDGFNLYHGLRSKRWRKYYWLDLWALAEQLLKCGQALVEVVYCTTMIKGDPDGQKRQLTFIDALKAHRPGIKVVYGHYLAKEIKCFNCQGTYTRPEEKMTDVNIACHLLMDAMDCRFDVALLLSADSDLVPPVQTVRQRWPQKRVIAVFPPGRHSDALKRACHGHTCIGEDTLRRSQLPVEIHSSAGRMLRRPEEWSRNE